MDIELNNLSKSELILLVKELNGMVKNMNSEKLTSDMLLILSKNEIKKKEEEISDLKKRLNYSRTKFHDEVHDELSRLKNEEKNKK